MVGLILIVNHMLSLKSFGVPYLSPIVPGNFQGMKDTVVRLPLWTMRWRPAQLHTPNDVRVGKRSLEALSKPVSNTLDPLKVGNHRKEFADGISSPSHSDSNGDRRI
jgi:spore germination protein KA